MRGGWRTLWKFITARWTRYVAAWLGCLAWAGYAQHQALHIFDSRATDPQHRRPDGNDGHTGIDFAGQWILGRMLVLGHGRELYNLHRLYEVAQRAFPREAEAPAAKHHDADDLIDAFMDTEVAEHEWSERSLRERRLWATFAVPLGSTVPWSVITATAAAQESAWSEQELALLRSKHVGGPLYPPIHAFVMAPLALDDQPQRAYFMMTWLMLGAAFFAGAGVSFLTAGRIWWPVATAMMLAYPGFTGGHQLGQNAPLSAAIVVWGWALTARGRPILGGLIWSLLAFKPTWAVSFLLVPLLTRRWQALAAMIAGGAIWSSLTVPFVGIDTWRDWLAVGSTAQRTYHVDANWIFLSRDVLGIPRRWMIDQHSSIPYFLRDRWEAHVAGWAIWLIIVETTVRLSQWLPAIRGAATGPGAALILLGAWLACLHFMYYDVLLSFVAFVAILDPPARLWRPRFLVLHSETDSSPPDPEYFAPKFAKRYPGTAARRTFVANSVVIYFGVLLLLVQFTLPWLDLTISIRGRHIRPLPPTTASGTIQGEADGEAATAPAAVEVTTQTKGPPWDTACLIILWAYCGVAAVVGAWGRREGAQEEFQPGPELSKRC